MQTISNEFFNKINSLSQTTCLKASLTYKNAAGATITEELTEEDFFGDGVKTVSDCMSSGDFTFGGTVCKEITCTLDNTKEKYYGCNFTNGKIVVYSGLVLDSGEEYVKLGEFNLEKAGKPATTVKLTGYDNMLKFDIPIDMTNIIPISTIKEAVQAACATCGVELSGDFKNSSLNLAANFDDSMTWREVVGWCAAAAGGFARINRDGKLEIVTFSKSNAYEINPETTRLSIEVEDHHKITGLIYYGTDKPIIYGDKKYPIIIEENNIFEMLNDSDLKNMLEGLYNDFVGHTYCGFSLDYLGNPALDEGDYLYLPSAQGDNVYALCGKCEFKHMGKSTLSCPAVSYYDKQYDQGNRKKDDKEEETPDGKNLLLISKFTKATLPITGVDTWTTDLGGSDSKGLECLDTYQFQFTDFYEDGSYINRFWLPYEGDLKAETEYTLSLYIKARLPYQNLKYYLYMVPRFSTENITGRGIMLNAQADAFKITEVSGARIKLGEITLTDDWSWQTITFTTPKEFPYNDLTGGVTGMRGYMLAMYAEQQGFYALRYQAEYGAHLQLAKLELGSTATEWCPGNTERILANEILNDEGYVTHTIAANSNYNCSVYSYKRMEPLPITIMFNDTGSTVIFRQKRRADYPELVDFQAFYSSSHFPYGCNGSQPLPGFALGMYTDQKDNTIDFDVTGGININGNNIIQEE